jgi:hypothetical protein
MPRVRVIALVSIVAAAAVSRLIPHPPNFTPIGAIALFAGAQFSDKRAALAVPLLAMLLSDLGLGDGIHPLTPYVYGSFALIVGFGILLRQRLSALRIAGATAAGSVLFFAITNLGVWLQGGLYPRSPEGLVACYIAAVPFFGNTLAGDATYTLLLFGGFAISERLLPALRDEKTLLLARH